MTIIPVEVLNEQLSLLVGRYVTTKAIRVRNKDTSLRLIINAGELLASSRRLSSVGKSLSAVK